VNGVYRGVEPALLSREIRRRAFLGVTLGSEDSHMAKWFELDYEENVKDLEALIDGNELREVVLALVTIASGKAEHLRTNWQDSGAAKDWERAACLLEKVADKLEV
jgi:hypothetical protein